MDNNTLRAAKQLRELRVQRNMLDRLLKYTETLEARLTFLEGKMGIQSEVAEKSTPDTISSKPTVQEESPDSSIPEEGNLVEELPEGLEELKAKCDELGIKYHPLAKEKSLREKIQYHFVVLQEGD